MFKTSISRNYGHRVLHSRFPPFGFVLKPAWSVHIIFRRVLVDSCQKSFFKTSISRNHAHRVLHSRFPPLGFVLMPVWTSLKKCPFGRFISFYKSYDGPKSLASLKEFLVVSREKLSAPTGMPELSLGGVCRKANRCTNLCAHIVSTRGKISGANRELPELPSIREK